MTRPGPVCDVPHCGRPRQRWQRLCADCYRRLPGEIRVGLAEAKRQHRPKDWRTLRARAAEFLNMRPAPAPAVSPQQAYALNARILGERID